MRSELQLSSEPNASRLRTLAAFISSCADQLAFKFGKASQHSQHQPAMSCSCVGPRISQGFESRVTLGHSISTFSKSLVDRASLSSRVTISTSSAHSEAIARARAFLSVTAPLTFSEYICVAPAAFSAACCALCAFAEYALRNPSLDYWLGFRD
jgi:hypothetical protein